MTCLAYDCRKPATSLGLCIVHFQRPDRKRRMSAKRKAIVAALAEKFVSADDPPLGWVALPPLSDRARLSPASSVASSSRCEQDQWPLRPQQGERPVAARRTP